MTFLPPHITGGLWTIYVLHLPQHAKPLKLRHYSVTHTDPKAKEAVLPSWESLQKANTGYRNRNLPSLCLMQCFKNKVSFLIRINPILTLFQVTSKMNSLLGLSLQMLMMPEKKYPHIHFVSMYTEWMHNPQQVTWPFSPSELHILWLATILAV